MSIVRIASELWKLVKDNKSLIVSSAKLVKVKSLTEQIDKLIKRYSKIKELPNSVRAKMAAPINLELEEIELRLRKLSSPQLPKPKFIREKPKGKDLARDFAGVAIKATASSMAQSELSRIYLERMAGRLPANPEAWEETRKHIVNYRANAIRLNLRLRQSTIRIQKRIAKTDETADQFREVEKAPYFDREQQAMLDLDWDELENLRNGLNLGNRKLRSWIALSEQIIRNCNSIIVLGDIANLKLFSRKSDAELIKKSLNSKN